MVDIDVCIVSYAKTSALRIITETGIESLLASEKHIQFNIFVVESNRYISYDHFPGVKTIYSGETFGYNKYLNLAVSQGTSEYVALCNSDLIYEKGWASEIILRMKLHPNLLSASPFCPQTQDINDWKYSTVDRYDIHFGRRVRRELAGWCIFQQRKIYSKIGKLNEEVDFWFSDNIYADQLEYHGIAHALITGSVVNHHEYNLGITGNSVLSEKEMDNFTTGQHIKYLKARENLYKHKNYSS